MSVFRAGQPMLRLTALFLVSFQTLSASHAQDNPLIPAPVPGATPPAVSPPVKPAPPKPQGPSPAVRQAAAQFGRALQLQRAHRVAPAIAAYKEFLRLATAAKLPRSASVPAYGNLALLYAAQGQQQAQADALRDLLAIDPNNAQGLSQLANVDLSMGRTAQGKMEALKAASLTKDPKVIAAAHYAIANAMMRQNDNAQAVKEYTLALKAMPNTYLTLMNRCVAYQRLKRYPEALADARQARNVAPNAIEPRAYIAGLYEEKKDWPAAISTYRDALRLAPKSSFLLFHLAIAQQQAKKPQDALVTYLELAKVAPEYYPAQLNLAELYYESGNYADAKAHFASAVKRGPKNTVPPLMGLALSEVHLAGSAKEAAARDSNFKSAESHLQQVLTIQPENKQAQATLLYVYQAGGKPDAAIALIRKQLAKKPDDVSVVRQLAQQYQGQNKPDDALKVWRDYRSQNPNDPVSYQEAARLLQAQNKPDDALKELQTYAAAHPDDGAIQVTIADALTTAGKKDEARKAYNAVLSIDTSGAGVSDPKAKEKAIDAAESARVQAAQGLALLAQQDSKWDEAIQYWSQAKTLQATQSAKNKTAPNGTAYRSIGYAYEQLKKLDLAEREYQSLAQVNPKDPQVQYDLARVYDAENKNDEAIAAYRKASETGGDKLGPLLQVPMLYRRKNDNDRAFTEYAVLFKQYPTDIRLLLPYAQFAAAQGKDETAADVYAAIRKADPTATWAESEQAAALVRLKRYDAALPLYEAAAARSPDTIAAYEDIKKIYIAENKSDALLPWLQGQLEKNPGSRALMNYFVQQYADRKREGEGLLIVKTIVAKHEKDPNVLLSYASVLTERKQTADLPDVYRRIAAQNPNDINAIMQYVSVLETDGKANDAMTYLEDRVGNAVLAATYSQADKRVINRRLAELYKQHGKPEKAIAIYQETVKDQPNDYMANSNLAQLLTDAGRTAEAIKIYDYLLTNRTNAAGTQAYLHNRLGSLYEKQNDKSNAVKQYREALKANARDAQAAESLKRLGENP